MARVEDLAYIPASMMQLVEMKRLICMRVLTVFEVVDCKMK